MACDLVIYHSNDMHDRPGVLDLLHRLPRSRPSLLLDSGDAIAGSNTVFRMHEPILDRMRASGYHAMAMGNRELHYLNWVRRLRAESSGFPILAANLRCLDGGVGCGWTDQVELHLGSVRVGLFGATPLQYRPRSGLERLTGLRFLDPLECLPPLAEQLRPRCDVVIFLSHLGLDYDRRLAPRMPGVDLILGGHSHDLLPQPERIGQTLVMQTGCYGQYLGVAELELDPLRVRYSLRPT